MEDKFKRAVIIGSGEDVPGEAPIIAKDTLVIAADGGLKQAYQWGLTPDYLLGDFDSLDLGREQIDLPADRIIRFPVEKDQTDLELAVDFALARGVDEIILTGAWGGSISHSLGNLELLYLLAQKQIQAEIITNSARIYTVKGELKLELPTDSRISLVPLSETAAGVTTKGLYYPLRDAVVAKGSTWTIGNKTVEKCIQISCTSGILIAVVELKNPR
jgi:thiamine pyrophosphokinase